MTEKQAKAVAAKLAKLARRKLKKRKERSYYVYLHCPPWWKKCELSASLTRNSVPSANVDDLRVVRASNVEEAKQKWMDLVYDASLLAGLGRHRRRGR